MALGDDLNKFFEMLPCRIIVEKAICKIIPSLSTTPFASRTPTLTCLYAEASREHCSEKCQEQDRGPPGKNIRGGANYNPSLFAER